IIVNGQGFRMPNNSQLCQFLLKNGPMYVTSANISGQDPIDISEANKYFPLVKNVYDFGRGNNKASFIYNIDEKKWIR
ncbi:Sua5/YciO/YrdC/YwlC family protein, partial [Enterococcus faecalis]